MNRLPAEQAVAKALAAFNETSRDLLLSVLSMPGGDERAFAIGEIWADERWRPLAEVLIDCEAEPGLRVFVVGMLRQAKLARGEESYE